ncbi:MAG: hypothetical protein KGZ30_02305 [Anaplasmataceae bacterium]|nr:hypothetical protein [Anaplasmataceae bacterium]
MINSSFFLKAIGGFFIALSFFIPNLGLADGPFDPVEDARQIHNAMAGAGTNEQAVYNILQQRSPSQLREIKRNFDNTYGSYWNGDLYSALRSDFGGFQLNQALATFHDPALDARILHDAFNGAGTDEEAMFLVIENRNRNELSAIASQFASQFGSQWGGRSLRDVLTDELSGEEEERALQAFDYGNSLPNPDGSDGDFPSVVINTMGQTCDQTTPPAIWSGGYWASDPPLLPCYGLGCLECGWCGLMILAQRIFYFLMSVVIYLIVPVRILWGGFMIATAGASAGNMSKGREIIYRTLIGMVLIVGAFLVIQTFLWLIGEPEEVGWPNFICPVEIVPTAPQSN